MNSNTSKRASAPEGLGLRVLAAEDSPVFQNVLRAMLGRWGYTPVIARDGREAWEFLNSDDPPHLALLDWMMPGMDGVEICRRLRAKAREPYIYIVLLTARTKAQDLIEGMEAGADDYLRKPFAAEELRVRMRAGRRILDLQAQLVAAREKLRDQALHDALTGLANRRATIDALNNALARAARDSTPVSVLMCDLDHFKSINDRYGHLAGDQVLTEAANRMRAAVRLHEVIGRYGGEEFMVVLPGTALAGARALAERLRASLSSGSIVAEERPLTVTCSVGVSWRDLPQSADAAALIREADQALYRAKANGRNCVACYEAELVAA